MFRRAIELNPNYVPAHQWLQRSAWHFGRRRRGVRLCQRAWELDPLSAVVDGSAWADDQETVGRFTRPRRVPQGDRDRSIETERGICSIAFSKAYALKRFTALCR